jgi:hypothetical protein
MDATAKADAPPPDGSTATNTCRTVSLGRRGSTQRVCGCLLRKASMSVCL